MVFLTQHSRFLPAGSEPGGRTDAAGHGFCKLFQGIHDDRGATRIWNQCRHHSSRRGCRTGFRDTSRCCAGRFAKQVAGNVDKSEAPTFLRERIEIRLYENLDGLFAGINLDTNGRVAEIDLVASSVLLPNDGVGHYRLAFQGSAAISDHLRPVQIPKGGKRPALQPDQTSRLRHP